MVSQLLRSTYCKGRPTTNGNVSETCPVGNVSPTGWLQYASQRNHPNFAVSPGFKILKIRIFEMNLLGRGLSTSQISKMMFVCLDSSFLEVKIICISKHCQTFAPGKRAMFDDAAHFGSFRELTCAFQKVWKPSRMLDTICI